MLLLAFAGMGCRQDPEVLTASGAAAYEASLAVGPSGFVAAWHDSLATPSVAHATRLDADGRAEGETLTLSSGSASAWEVDVEGLQDGFAAAWYETRPGARDRAVVAGFGPGGAPLWRRSVGSADVDNRNPVLVREPDGLFVAWLERHDSQAAVRAQRLGPDGADLCSAIRLGAASERTWNLNAARQPEGGIAVVWDAATATEADEIVVARVGPPAGACSSEPARNLTRDDGYPSKYPDIAFADDRVAVAWFDERDGNREIYLATWPLEAWPQSLDDASRRVTTTPGASIGAYVAAAADHWGLAWSDHVEGNHEVFFQAFDLEGAEAGPAQRLTRNPTESLIPAIEATGDGDFALAWNEDVAEERGSHLVGGRSSIVFQRVRP